MSEKTKKKVVRHRPKLPPWIRVRIGAGGAREEVDSILKDLNLNTVCQSAVCPNLNECWHARTATFMILGEFCTRNCRFCAVGHKELPTAIDPNEPEQVAQAALKMNLKYAVVTSVTRDDLPDGGAQHFADVISALKSKNPEIGVEVLTPDFKGVEKDIQTVLDAKPVVFNHNVETVERLSGEIRSGAVYRRSLAVLAKAVELAKGTIEVKSGLMVGLGETDDEINVAIQDIRDQGATILTIGQYLPPTAEHWELKRYVEPKQFDAWRDFALSIGFRKVASAPLVRSSYHAGELMAYGSES
jgi:lipoic acid synthetase